jgi:hypothetical protein
MRAKLLDYIEQVFECKADTPYIFAHCGARTREERDWRDGRDGKEFEVRSSRFSEFRTQHFEH